MENAAAIAAPEDDAGDKDDLARLFHLWNHPDMQIHWAATMMGEDENPWRALAEEFNDYNVFRPQNVLLVHTFDENKGHLVPVMPLESASSETGPLFSKCSELNPTNLTRKDILRDGAYIRQLWTTYRRTLWGIFQDFRRSGRQTSESQSYELEQSRWAYHAGSKSRLHDACTTYTFAIFEEADFERIRL